ncbi:MAG: hypothetical protein WCG27_07425 [Pseudomonadota bacterium]
MAANKFSLIFILVLLLGLWGCEDKIAFESKEGRTLAKNVRGHIDDIEAVNWDVDWPTTKNVTSAVLIKIILPAISTADVELLSQKHGVDSWLVMTYKETNYRKTLLGTSSTNFIQGWDGNIVNMKVYYNDMLSSELLKKFACPINGHNKVVGGLKVQSNVSEHRQTSLYPTNMLYPDAQSQMLTPPKWNGGNTLEGTYTVEFAFFNRKEKQVYGDIFNAENKAVVAKESTFNYQSCRDF